MADEQGWLPAAMITPKLVRLTPWIVSDPSRLEPAADVYAHAPGLQRGFMAGDRESWPDEQRAGEICVKRLLSGERGHYGPLEHAQIVLNVGWFPTR